MSNPFIEETEKLFDQKFKHLDSQSGNHVVMGHYKDVISFILSRLQAFAEEVKVQIEEQKLDLTDDALENLCRKNINRTLENIKDLPILQVKEK